VSDPVTNDTQKLRSIKIAICFILVAITAAIYLQVTSFDFINFDDPAYVYENDVVQQGVTWQGIVWSFVREHASNWHPLTWISHMVDAQLYGLRAGGHHLTNVILHTITGVLLFLFLNRVTRAVWRSAFVAALFLWHPMHVESVAWISERKDVLSALFFVLTLMAYARYAESKTSGSRFYICSLLFFTLGLLAKSMLVTLPFVLLLLDVWPLQRWRADKQTTAQLIREKIPFFILSIASSIATYVAQKTSGAVAPLDRLPFADRLGNALLSYTLYVEKLFWPADLTFFYPFPKPIPWAFVVPAVVMLLFVSMLVIAGFRKFPWATVGWFWFIGMLFPVIGIVQVGRQAMADRYSYLPSIGLFIAATWTAYALVGRAIRARRWLATIASVLLIALVITAYTQVTYWRNSATLAQHAIAVDPSNAYVRQNLGMYWFRHNRPDLALQYLQEADEMNPGDPGGLNALGWVLMTMGKTAEAQEKFRETLRINPQDAQALATLGTIAVGTGHVNEGLDLLRKSVAARPTHAEYRYELAHALVVANQIEEAIAQYELVLKNDPAFLAALKDLAWIRATFPNAKFRNGKEAVRLAEQACGITTFQDPQCLNVLDAAFAEAGRFTDAIATAEKARTLYLKAGNTNAATMTEQRLSLYKNSQPFHTPPR
jgi:protein O-mannosyl-transferase